MTNFNKEHKRKGMTFDPKEGRTKQATVSVNINDIMARYHRENDLVPVAQTLAQYGDFSEVGDFQTALDQVMAAKSSFLELPAVVRSMCDNEPAKFIEWITNPANKEEAIKLKLIDPPRPKAKAVEVKVLQEPDGSVQGGE